MAKANNRSQESRRSFARRVLEATGVALADIPLGEEGDLLGGQIICRRGSECVVTSGYPTEEDEDGTEIWAPLPESFLRVVLS